MTELEQENLRLKDLLDQTPQLIHDYFDCRDISRFIDNLSCYQLLATDSDDEKEEPDFATVLPIKVTQELIKTPLDALVMYSHFIGHRICDDAWTKNKVPKNHFPQHAFDLIEDIYVQRIFQVIAPEIYDRFYQFFCMFDMRRPFQHRSIRSILNTMMWKFIYKELPQPAIAVHQFLYEANPLDQETFNNYIRYWYGLLKIPEFAELVEKYDA